MDYMTNHGGNQMTTKTLTVQDIEAGYGVIVHVMNGGGL